MLVIDATVLTVRDFDTTTTDASVRHYRILQTEDQFYYITPRNCFGSIDQLIDHYTSRSGHDFVGQVIILYQYLDNYKLVDTALTTIFCSILIVQALPSFLSSVCIFSGKQTGCLQLLQRFTLD